MKTVIELAHEVYGKNTEWDGASLKRLEQLVALAHADEREACAQLAEKLIWADNMGVASALRARSPTGMDGFEGISKMSKRQKGLI